ncbi:hypothetical protein VTO42DRAFT_3326 [Malbranchea cinnamomea]
MRSQLTRGVLQAIVDSRPYFHSRCRRKTSALFSSHKRGNQSQLPPRRQFFGFASPSAQVDKTKSTDDGTKQMMDLVHAINQRLRPPPFFAVARAFKTFIESRLEAPGTLSRNQVQFLILTFQHLLQDPYKSTTGSVRSALEPSNIENALNLLSRAKCEPDALELVNQFAKLLFQQLREELETRTLLQPSVEAICDYAAILSSTGSSIEAEAVLSFYSEKIRPAGFLPWVHLLAGVEREGKGEEAVKKWHEICHHIDLDQNSHEKIVRILADARCPLTVKAVYQTWRERGFQPTVGATVTAIKTAIWNSQIDWASSLANSLPSHPTLETLDTVLLLAAARGESPDSIEARLGELVARDHDIRRNLTISPINALLEYANQTNKSHLVEAYASVAKRWNLAPDEQTYKLLMEARLKMGDVQGALSVLRQPETETIIHQLPILIINEFVKHLCCSGRSEHDYDILLVLIDRLVEAKERFDPETLGVICLTLLYRRDLESVSNLLRPVIDSYNPKELKQIRDSFVRYISDMAEPTQGAWEAYQLLNMAFPSTSTREREALMASFFLRGRSDLACLVFGHMRQKEYSEARPTASTYALCFQGIAHSANVTSLHLVHNMLKLDLEVRPTTEILDGLTLAYAACGMPGRAMEFFRDILHSEEGPSENTLVVFFRVCETLPNGVQEATQMMEKLKSLDIQPDAQVYNAYIGALAGHCEVERAADAVQDMETKTGEPPSVFTLGTLYNAIPYQHWKEQAEQWAQKAYPKLWAQLEQIGRETDEDGNQTFKIDRRIYITRQPVTTSQQD